MASVDILHDDSYIEYVSGTFGPDDRGFPNSGKRSTSGLNTDDAM